MQRAVLAAVPATCGMKGFLSSIANTAPAIDPRPAAWVKNIRGSFKLSFNSDAGSHFTAALSLR